MPFFSFPVTHSSSQEYPPHCVGDYVHISVNATGKVRNVNGIVRKITSTYTFVTAEPAHLGEVRATHQFIELIEKRQSNIDDYKLPRKRSKVEGDRFHQLQRGAEREQE